MVPGVRIPLRPLVFAKLCQNWVFVSDQSELMPDPNILLEQIKSLEPQEREELLLVLIDMDYPVRSNDKLLARISNRGYPSIVSTPHVCGGASRLIRTRVPIWTLEQMRRFGVSDSDILRSFPNLRAADLVEAFSYAAHHRREIDQSIMANETE